MTQILSQINQTSDLRRLTIAEMVQLADEIRAELLRVVPVNGGHLASNLGVVELTIALHSIFDSPRDKIIWDVAHQSYVHKLLTGRRDKFCTLRQYGGLCGFTERSESIHDPFGAGHAGTSISAALGMAIARDLKGEDYRVVAVIGDGAMTSGMALEALNHAGHLGTGIIVILNDNAMAISPNVGALARSLKQIRLDRRYYRAKEGAEQVITKLPLGSQVWQASKQVKKSVKGLFTPSRVWEEFGFIYVGPIDGHDISELKAALQISLKYKRPVLVHVLTKKGKGFDPAEDDAISFHGLPPNGEATSGSGIPSFTEVFGKTCLQLARQNERVVAITAAMRDSTGLRYMASEFPGRVFDVGICEQHAVTFAAGSAAQGFIPIIAIYSTFLQRAFDQILHDVCLQNLPVVFALDRGGIVGEDGKTHQGIFDMSYLNCIPNMTVAAPKDENELQHLLYTAVEANCPMAIRYPRGAGFGVPLDSKLERLPLGRGEMLRFGEDVAIVAIGSMVLPALQAAEKLEKQGIRCAVFNARFAKPLDRNQIIDIAIVTQRLITVEENTTIGGFGSAVTDLLQSEGLSQVKVERIGIPDVYVEHGPQNLLRSNYDLDDRGIANRILQAFPELGAISSSVAGKITG